jgi:hypothetical protein
VPSGMLSSFGSGLCARLPRFIFWMRIHASPIVRPFDSSGSRPVPKTARHWRMRLSYVFITFIVQRSFVHHAAPRGVFLDMSGSFTFELGSTLSLIETKVFRACSSLSSICVPASVETIGESCFSDCSALTTVTFESG